MSDALSQALVTELATFPLRGLVGGVVTEVLGQGDVFEEQEEQEVKVGEREQEVMEQVLEEDDEEEIVIDDFDE